MCDVSISTDINDILDSEINNLLNKKSTSKHVKDILVLSGGSIKGIAQLGALHCLKKNKIIDKNIKTIASTSAGAITGVLYCVGYQPLEIYKILKLVDFGMIKNINPENIMSKYGLDDGVRVMLVIKKLITAKGYDQNITFLQLYKKTGITFIVTGTCINDKKIYYFSHKTSPNMIVMEAIRISISVPILFTPYEYEGKMFIDGGCIDNFPIHLFEKDIERVIGIYLTEERQKIHQIKYIDQYLIHMIDCLFEGIAHRDTRSYNKYIIKIECTKTGDSPSDMMILFDEGYKTAQNKIDSGDFL